MRMKRCGRLDDIERAQVPQPDAEIVVFVKEEDVLIEPPDHAERVGLYQQRATGKESSLAFSGLSARSPPREADRIGDRDGFSAPSPTFVEENGSEGHSIRSGYGRLNKHRNRALRDDDVRVEKQKVIPTRICSADIGRRAVSDVLVVLHAHTAEVSCEVGYGRCVLQGIVEHHDLPRGEPAHVGSKTRKEMAQRAL